MTFFSPSIQFNNCFIFLGLPYFSSCSEVVRKSRPPNSLKKNPQSLSCSLNSRQIPSIIRLLLKGRRLGWVAELMALLLYNWINGAEITKLLVQLDTQLNCLLFNEITFNHKNYLNSSCLAFHLVIVTMSQRRMGIQEPVFTFLVVTSGLWNYSQVSSISKNLLKGKEQTAMNLSTCFSVFICKTTFFDMFKFTGMPQSVRTSRSMSQWCLKYILI